VLLDVVVCDGVIFSEQWYTGSIFLGAARGDAPELRRPGKFFEKWKTVTGNCFEKWKTVIFCVLKIQCAKLFNTFHTMLVLNKRNGVRGGAPAKFVHHFLANKQMSRAV